MKLINQSHTVITEPNPYKLIEQCGRICYKSEDRITEDSASGFVSNLIKRGHLSVIEHAYIAFQLSPITIRDIKLTSRYNNFLTGVIDDLFITTSSAKNYIASANFRAWKEFLEIPRVLDSPGIKSIARYLNINYPEIFPYVDALPDNAKPITFDDMATMERAIHTVRTVKFITGRGVTHELVRHRPCAISQESTRYVRYDGNMEFVKPIWWKDQFKNDHWSDTLQDNSYKAQKRFVYFCDYTEQKYQELLQLGWPAQQARQVLSFSVKSEIIMTGTLRQWFHMFNLRCSKPAHPQIRALMKPVLKEFMLDEPKIFEQQKDLLN